MRKTFYITFSLAASAAVVSLQAQTRLEIGVQVNAVELDMPWNGGYNAPQFTNIDLNRDGIQDLIVFDRQGDQLRTYLRLPASGRWRADWTYTHQFPMMTDWVVVADYNGDGVEDLFTASTSLGIPGVSVYKGKYEADQWSFEKQKDRGREYLQILSGGNLTNLYVSWDDIPSIVDVDGDGDLDILGFEPGGSFIAYFQNQSVESGWGRDSLRFTLEDICWGKILENEFNEEVYLSDDPDKCSDGNFTGEDIIRPRHAGSTIATVDVDFDGDLDAFVGDIASRRLVFLRNGLNAEQAWIIEQESHFPMEDTPVDIPFFVAGYIVELDDDPEPELLAAVNSRALAEDRVSIWRYDDDPLTDGPLLYQLEEKGFFQNQMIDPGTFSRPAVADVNGDGLKDIVVGSYHYTEGSETRIPRLWLFENIGSLAQPYFELTDEDYLGMSQFASFPTFDYAPAFGDIDGNGSVDLVVGEQNGQLFFYRNIAAKGEPFVFDQPVYPYMNIAVGVSATPQIVDINGDGLGDLVIGERTGNSDNVGRCSNLNYFENVGTAGSAQFGSNVNEAPNTQCFGRVLFDVIPGLPQYSSPSIVPTPDGLIMLLGSDPGNLYLYDQVEDGKTGACVLLDNRFENIDVGNRSTPALADVDEDGTYELIVGNQRGGLELFGTLLQVGSTSINESAGNASKPYDLFMESDSRYLLRARKDFIGQVQVVDLSGRMVANFGRINQTDIHVDLKNVAPGIYLLRFDMQGIRYSEKIIVVD